MTDVYLLKIGGELTHGEMAELSDALGEAMDRAGLDSECILFNREVEAIDKEELLEALE